MKTNASSEMDNASAKQSLSGNAIKIWYTRSTKLAVAVAIIKARPSGKSGRQYAEQLACRFNHLEQSWKMKAKGLQEEVLQLRQELLLSKMLLKPNRNSKNGGGLMEILSQDLIPSLGPLSSEQMNSVPDSGCGTENSTESLQQSLCVEKGQTETSAPIPSHPRQPHFPQTSSDRRENALLSHMQFLQNFCSLRKLGARGLSLDGYGAVVWDSVCQLLGSLVPAASRDVQCHLQQALLPQASQVVAQVVDEWRAHCKPPGLFLTQAEDCLKKLTGHLLNNTQLNRFPSQECLSDCLIRLGGSATLRPTLLCLLFSHINHLANHLWHTCQETASGRAARLEVGRYENSFYLLWVLEQVLRDAGAPELREAQAQLERQVLRLADEYPLFSLYLWRIGALLKPEVST
ncbi:meiosis-specific protein MEI4 isoform X2 [Alosa sapidissima]|uniref:meiosis-specific protein MEI4 isoform X2 n=1 Tax=Alosa sapidissima TaxID=34773 RepID=UPI001C099B37|nr:meiosis-specific protein MEI4 isoform X2 [Alosa sapidissima]